MPANDFRGRAYDALVDAEKKLQGLLVKAVQDGDYNATADINQALQEVARVKRPLVRATGAKGAPGAGVSPTKYYRDDQQLVLEGKSKKRPGESYQHKCPKLVIDNVVTALLRSKHPITPTGVLVESLPEFPAYQPMTCLRWLKDVGLVKKYGHKGYKVLDPQQFEANVAMQWEQLPAS
jgi:hypothetical protein